MSEHSKVTASHRSRQAVVYVRQSTLTQLERNVESTARQYDLRERAVTLGWTNEQVRVIDVDLGISGSVLGQRTGFETLVADVAMGQIGIVLALEVSRLARDNAAWYRLLDLAGACDTLVADADGIYHPGLFNDRLLLGMKGMLSECELHVLRARLTGGIRNKAARGELRTGLPVGLVWGQDDGEIRLHPDEAVTGVIAAVFDQFAVCGSVRATWLWLRDNQLRWPLQRDGYRRDRLPEITWVEPTYHAVHTTLTHPAYAGAYVFGRTRRQRYVAADGHLRVRERRLRQDEWEVLITDHHRGFIDWHTYQANQDRIGGNIRPQQHQPGTGAVREGAALLQGLATCGMCGRKLAVFYRGPAKSTPGYYCNGTGELVDGKGVRHLNVGGQAIDAAVAEAFLAALSPATVQACLAATEQLQAGHDAARDQHRRQVEQARYAAMKAERRYRAVDPENRLVARGLETEWNSALQHVADAEAELARRQQRRPVPLTDEQRATILALGDDLNQVWAAPTTTDKDRKQLLRTLLDEVHITVHRDDHPDPHAELLLRWKGGIISELSVPLRRPQPSIRTDEDTIDLLRRLAVHYPDTKIAGILNRQGRRTARGLSYTASRVASLRHHWNIPCHQPTDQPPEGELLNVTAAAKQLAIAASTLLRWLNDGFVAGEQLTPGAPWRIRITDQLRGMLVNDAPNGWLALHHASRALGVSRQTVLQKVKRGELDAVLTRTGRRKGLRINVSSTTNTLF
jgi:DNA invertase Pin-like site-specific DNA recombinase